MVKTNLQEEFVYCTYISTNINVWFQIDMNTCDNISRGLRPVICLLPNVKLVEQIDGTYNIE